MTEKCWTKGSGGVSSAQVYTTQSTHWSLWIIIMEFCRELIGQQAGHRSGFMVQAGVCLITGFDSNRVAFGVTFLSHCQNSFYESVSFFVTAPAHASQLSSWPVDYKTDRFTSWTHGVGAAWHRDWSACEVHTVRLYAGRKQKQTYFVYLTSSKSSLMRTINVQTGLCFPPRSAKEYVGRDLSSSSWKSIFRPLCPAPESEIPTEIEKLFWRSFRISIYHGSVSATLIQ